MGDGPVYLRAETEYLTSHLQTFRFFFLAGLEHKAQRLSRNKRTLLGMHSNLTSTSTCALTLNMCSKPLVSVGLKDTLKSFAEQGIVMGLHIHLELMCVLQCLPAQTADKEPDSSNNQSA